MAGDEAGVEVLQARVMIPFSYLCDYPNKEQFNQEDVIVLTYFVSAWNLIKSKRRLFLCPAANAMSPVMPQHSYY